jgi:hypothetical protein
MVSWLGEKPKGADARQHGKCRLFHAATVSPGGMRNCGHGGRVGRAIE